ncbi:MAG: ATP-binding cassette domain-containing protein [Gammaproteobacteria bacterium]|nr:ATP-binding cassette domain-containing protein [Gammaproteobacteria bacterium]
MHAPAPVKPILSVRRLKVHYPLPRQWPWEREGVVRAVDDVHFNLYPGETLGIVGESGCGKSTLARALVGLQPVGAGGIAYGAHDLARLPADAWRPLRRDIQMVFQDPVASLDPRMTIGESVAEPLRALQPELGEIERGARVARMLERVGLSAAHANRYPHELSGGQCQRAGIARALILRPKILVCDEPVSALDVSVQAQIVNLLRELQREYGLSLIFIAHDLAVVRHVAHRVLVMYLGRVMEQASCDELFAQPRHPYTRALLAAVPSAEPDGAQSHPRTLLEGELPSPAVPPSGCVFRTRCPIADTHCAREAPYLRRVGATAHAACHYVSGDLVDARAA